MCKKSTIHTMTVELHYKPLKIDASNLYCKITLVWLDSSLSVLTEFHNYPVMPPMVTGITSIITKGYYLEYAN